MTEGISALILGTLGFSTIWDIEMGQKVFDASVQYNDFTGTAAADNHDMKDLSSYLKKGELLSEQEHLVGVEVYSGEIHRQGESRPIRVTALVAEVEGFDELSSTLDSKVPLKVRRIELSMGLDGFFDLFKRFNICISTQGAISGRDVQYDDE